MTDNKGLFIGKIQFQKQYKNEGKKDDATHMCMTVGQAIGVRSV